VKEHRITDKHYKKYQEYCDAWIKELGLTEWAVDYDRYFLPGYKASCSTHYTGCLSTLTISDKWETGIKIRPTDKELRKTALHEVLHMLLAKMAADVKDRSYHKEEVEMHEHEVVNRLVKVLL